MPKNIRADGRPGFIALAHEPGASRTPSRTLRVLYWIDRMGVAGSIFVACCVLCILTVSIASTVHYLTGDPIGRTGLFNTAVLPFALGAPTLMVLLSVLRQLEDARAELARLSTVDVLTGILNRRSFLSAGESTVADCGSADRHVSVAMIDADLFKEINDEHGHLAGDLVLRQIAESLAQALPAESYCGRLGGEEFGVVFPGLDHAQALSAAESLRASVEQGCKHIGKMQVGATISLGVATSHGEAQLYTLLSNADDALYAAKSAGRNQVVSAEPT